MPVRAYAPASIGNFAAGFDLMGAALAPLDGSLWGDVVSAEPAAATSLSASGPYSSYLPADPWQNLVLRTFVLYREAVRRKGLDCPDLAFHLEKNLPRSSGLGSSASSVAATLTACQGLLGEPLTRTEVYEIAGQGEALVSGSVHLDNVVPSLSGGLRIVVPGPEGGPEARPLPWPADLVLAVVSPELELSTHHSRQALPRRFPLADTLAFAQNLAGFILALENGDRDLLRRCLRDVLAEPYRAPLVTGFRAAQAAAREAGSLGGGLSGSGPALFGVAESPDHGREVAAALQRALREAGVESQARLCGLDFQGARLL